MRRTNRYEYRANGFHEYAMVLLVILAWHVTGVCGPYYDSLGEGQMRVYENAQKGYRILQCGNVSLAKSLSSAGACPVAPRLSSFAAWLTYLNKDSAYIVKEIAERYESFTSENRHAVDCSLFEIAGDAEAPVTVAIYISIGCPFCKTVCNFMHDSVTAGSLKGKARVCVKLLSASDRDMALLAAHGCGKFWEYMKALSQIERRLDIDVLLDAAEELDMPMKAFKAYMKNPAVRAHALASREEALRNGVKSTPTFFINGRRYYSYYNPMWIVDAVKYEYGQVRANTSP